MIPLPKPRGFWDYALFALTITGALVFMFWLDRSDGVGWPDAALALTAAVLFVFAIILARRGEEATWIVHPTWKVYALAAIGAFVLLFGALYADIYFLHPKDFTSKRLSRDVVAAIAGTTGTLWSLRRRLPAKRQLL
jgi:H+/Cl- antiporter ClcA